MPHARWIAPLLVAALLVAATAQGGAVRSASLGRLRVTILEDATGAGTPARVEVLSERGESRLPVGARPFSGDCDEPPSRRAPPDHGFRRSLSAPVIVPNPAAGTTQFYALAPFEMALPPGEYGLTVRKKPE